MPTQFVHRLVMIVPVARIPAVGTWFAANIDPADDCTTWPGLNATGLPTDPVTARWASMALTDAQCKALLLKVCQLASVPPPTAAQWSGWTWAQKRTWLVGVRAAFATATGIWISLSQNDGAWDDPHAERTGRGLKVITAAGP